jgi:membrane-bound ClpP family serine protease
MPKPESEVALGSIGVAVSRLAPMGKVSVAGKVYEAKSVDVFIDQREAVEVVGYENFNIVVKRVNN